MSIGVFLQAVAWASLLVIILYIAFLAILTRQFFQDQVIYLHSVTLTWFRDVNTPETWGFLPNQVTPFELKTPDGERLHAWHVLPLGLYKKYEHELREEAPGLVSDITARKSFSLLKNDPDALLVLYFHGAAGTLGSGYRPPSYRAIYAGAPKRIHIVAIDYRGFGSSTGHPSEAGLLTDALTVADWAMNVAGIPPERIVLFSQSLGTAVSLALAHNLALQSPSTLFAGMVLVAPFVDVEMLTATYRLAGTVPLLSPVARVPALLAFFNTFIKDKWSSKTRVAELVRVCEDAESKARSSAFQISIIHAKDDYDIPWSHSETLYQHAKAEGGTERGSDRHGDSTIEWRGKNSVVRKDIVRFGEHDKIMSHPIVTLAISRTFENAAKSLTL